MGLTYELENEISMEFSSESTNHRIPHVKSSLMQKQQEECFRLHHAANNVYTTLPNLRFSDVHENVNKQFNNNVKLNVYAIILYECYYPTQMTLKYPYRFNR